MRKRVSLNNRCRECTGRLCSNMFIFKIKCLLFAHANNILYIYFSHLNSYSRSTFLVFCIPLQCVQAHNSSRVRLGWIISYVCCIFVHPDLASVSLFVRMQKRSFLQLTEPYGRLAQSWKIYCYEDYHKLLLL